MSGPVTYGQVVTAMARRLAAAGIEGARLDARLIVCRATGLEAASLLARSDSEASPEQLRAIEAMTARRERREPMAHILGEREFWSLPFRVTPETLIPRPDTETLVEAALDWVRGRNGGTQPLRVLDLGTGTGCILLSLLAEWPDARGTGVDISPGALAVARDNADRLGLADRAQFIEGDWASARNGEFDVIVSNPPYIPEGEIDGLAPEVARFDPRLALSGGEDGLAAYRKIASAVRASIASEGRVFLEIGQGQEDAVFRIMEGMGLRRRDAVKDLAGMTRCLVVSR